MLKTVAAAGAVGVAGCTGDGAPAENSDPSDPAGDDGAESPDTEGLSWVGAQSSEAPNYNVFRVTDTTSGNRITRVQDPAYAFDEDNEFVPRLVRDYDVNDDFTEFTFTITEHGEWSDPYGAMTAEDWVYSISEVIQGEDNWAAVSMADDFRMPMDEVPDGFDVASEPEEEDGSYDVWFNVERTGEYEFTIETPDSYPAFIEEPILWGFQEVVPKDLLEPYVEQRDGAGINEDDEIQSLSYTGNLGAFDIEVLETEARMFAVADDDYYLTNHEGYEDTPYMDDWTYQVMREESTRLAAIQAEDITATGIPAARAEEFEEHDEIQVIGTPTVYCQSMFYNMRDDGWEALNVTEVRQALTMAIDREEIVSDIREGYGDVAHTLQPEYSEFYDDSEVVVWEYDPDAARERMAEHLPNPFHYDGGRVVDGNGEEVVLNFVYGDAAESTDLMARYIQQELDENLGIDVELDPVPWNTMLDEYLYSTSREWAFMAGIGRNSYPRAPEATEGYWRPGESANGYGYDDPEGVADLLAEAQRMTDPEARQENLSEVYGILSEEQPWAFLYFPQDLNGYRHHVEPTEDPSIAWGYDITNWAIEDEQ
ncbi:hypothetical protein JCM17823_08790 [Halorubrum gandharaense]